jgi:sensor histidine kinase regulating citrate/malate metabolism
MQEDDLKTYWKAVVDTIQEGVMIVDPGGVIVAVNQALS